MKSPDSHSVPNSAKQLPKLLANIGAKKVARPKWIAPQLALAFDEAPAGTEWLHEVKFDGYRMIALVDGKSVRLISRNSVEWTSKFPTVIEGLRALKLNQRMTLDGEVAAVLADGRTSFHALRNSEDVPLAYFLFDIITYGGFDLRDVPLIQRKAILEAAVFERAPKSEVIQYSGHVVGGGEKMFKNACRMKLEGIISKRVGSLYISKRSDDWRKIKCVGREEFAVGGYSVGKDGKEMGALLLGYYNKKGEFLYAGRVGTGFSHADRKKWRKILQERKVADSPFLKFPRGLVRKSHWSKPHFVVEVEFTEWTPSGALRHPSYLGLREDKSAKDVKRADMAAKK